MTPEQVRTELVRQGIQLDDAQFAKVYSQARSELEQTVRQAEMPSTFRTVARIGGGVVGGVAGGAFGAAAGGVGAIPGSVIGSGLGTAGGDLVADMVEGKGRSLLGQAQETGSQFLTGALSDLAGHGVMRALAPVGRVASSLLGMEMSPAAKAGVQQAQRFGIPLRASEITGSQAVQSLENMPANFPFGRGSVQRFAQGQMTAADEAAKRVVSSYGENVSKIVAGNLAKKDLKAALTNFRNTSDRLFRTVGQLAGDEPVVPTRAIRETVESILGKAEGTPLGAPGAVGRVAKTVGATPTTVSVGGDMVDVSKLPEGLRAAIGDATRVDMLTFEKARQLESQLGQLMRSREPIGTIQKGQLGRLYRAVRESIDAFMATPGGANVSPALAEAKQAYRTGHALFNDSIVKRLASRKGGLDVEEVVDRVFRPGEITDTLDFKQAVSTDTYKQSVASWLGDLYTKAVIGGVESTQFSPSVFVKAVKPYLANGHLDVILEPKAAEQVKAFVGVLERIPRAEGAALGRGGGGFLTTSQVLGALTSAGALAAGQPGAAAAAGVAAAAPGVIGKLTTSDRGIRLLSEGVLGSKASGVREFVDAILGYPAAIAGRAATQTVGQTVGEQF
jgi:hypothetical protein